MTTEGAANLTHNSLDRLMTSVPPTSLALTMVQVSVSPIANAISTPTYDAPSDHLPAKMTLRVRPTPPAAHRHIPPWVTRHPAFTRDVSWRLDRIPYVTISTVDALRRTRQAIRGAAASVRNATLSRTPKRPQELRKPAVQTLRAPHRRDAQALRREMPRWLAIRSFIRIADDAVVILDPKTLYATLGTAALHPDMMFSQLDETAGARTSSKTGSDYGSHTCSDNGSAGS